MKKQEKTLTTRKKRTSRKPEPPATNELREAGQRVLTVMRTAYGYVLAMVRPFRVPTRRLRSMETLSLPNKQTVSLVQVDGQEFLIGGTANSVVLLARLEQPAPHRKARAATTVAAALKNVKPASVVAAPAKAEPLVVSFAAKVQ